MILEFQDGEQIEVIAIFGGPRLIDGVMRDTLRIEVDTRGASLPELETVFKDRSKTNHLYTFSEQPNEEGWTENVKVLSGEGYNVFVSAESETRLINHPPGRIYKEEKETIYVVTIAQMTYDEYKAAYPDAIT